MLASLIGFTVLISLQGDDAFVRYREHVAEFVAQRRSLTPDEEGRRWVDLLQESHSVAPPQGSYVAPEGLFDLVPEPDAWPFIIDQLRAKAVGNSVGDNADRILAAVFEDNVPLQYDLALSLYLRTDFPKGGPDRVLRSATERLGDPHRANRIAALREASYSDGPLDIVPDLVNRVGAARAEPALREVLLAAQGEVQVAGRETLAMAKRITFEDVEKLKGPKWNLVSSMDDWALYEAMVKRFPAESQASRRASYHAFLGYVNQGGTAKALAIAREGGHPDTAYLESDLKRFDQSGKRLALLRTLDQVFEEDPRSQYFDLAFELNPNGPWLRRVADQMLAGRKKRSKRNQWIPESNLRQALLANGRVEEYVGLVQNSGRYSFHSPFFRENDAHLLIRLGRLTGRADWVSSGIRKGIDYFKTPRMGSGYATEREVLLKFLTAADDIPFAEEALAASLPRMNPRPQILPTVHLISQLGVLHRAGRFQEARKLIDEDPRWEVGDVRFLLGQSSAGQSFAAVVGSTLAHTGDVARGVNVLKAGLRDAPIDDDAARYLVDAAGDDAIPFLRSLLTLDRFEERPLIWIAYAHLKAGRLRDAEATAREAIAMDPSDTDSIDGRRMMAYSILGDVLAAQGKERESAAMRDEVAGIRLMERADEAFTIGLIDLSMKTFEAALDCSPNSFLIHSRFASRLSQVGQKEKAKRHFQRAYERLPYSFGRVENHCFGCDGLFSRRSIELGAKILRDLATQSPENPQVHYYLGVAKERLGDSAGALAHWRRAVQLDADYLNAWVAIGYGSLPAVKAEREQTVAAFRRLDPLGYYSPLTFRPLRERYEQGRDLLNGQPPIPYRLYPFGKASADPLIEHFFVERRIPGPFPYERAPRSPERLLASDPVLSSALRTTRRVRVY